MNHELAKCVRDLAEIVGDMLDRSPGREHDGHGGQYSSCVECGRRGAHLEWCSQHRIEKIKERLDGILEQEAAAPGEG